MTSPLFVVGAQRSGTTALAHAIAEGAHRAGGCFTVNGKLFYLARRWITENDVRARHLRVDEILYALTRRRPLGYGAEEWMSRLEASLRSSALRVAEGEVGADPAAVAGLVRDIAREAYGPGPWGDKYNEYLLELDTLNRWFPEASWLFVARQPGEVRDSVRAWAGDRPWLPRSEAAIELRWVEWNRLWLAFRSCVGAARQLEVTYGDLCNGRAADAVEAFTGMSLDGLAAMRRPCRAESAEVMTREARDLWTRLLDVTSSS